MCTKRDDYINIHIQTIHTYTKHMTTQHTQHLQKLQLSLNPLCYTSDFIFLHSTLTSFFIWLCWSSLLMGFSLVRRIGATLLRGKQAFHCSGFSCGAQALGCMGFSSCSPWSPEHRLMGFSSCSSWSPEHRLNSCGSWVFLLSSMWDLGSGIELMSLALAGRFFTTETPWKASPISFCI